MGAALGAGEEGGEFFGGVEGGGAAGDEAEDTVAATAKHEGVGAVSFQGVGGAVPGTAGAVADREDDTESTPAMDEGVATHRFRAGEGAVRSDCAEECEAGGEFGGIGEAVGADFDAADPGAQAEGGLDDETIGAGGAARDEGVTGGGEDLGEGFPAGFLFRGERAGTDHRDAGVIGAGELPDPPQGRRGVMTEAFGPAEGPGGVAGGEHPLGFDLIEAPGECLGVFEAFGFGETPRAAEGGDGFGGVTGENRFDLRPAAEGAEGVGGAGEVERGQGGSGEGRPHSSPEGTGILGISRPVLRYWTGHAQAFG